MSTVSVNLLGFPAATQDMSVHLRDPLTRAVVATAQPFSDGTVKFPMISAGAYEIQVMHPNLVLPVYVGPIRVLPADTTSVSVLIDPSKFHDTPIADQTTANLSPVQQVVETISQSLVSISSKTAGEAIRAEDWNALVNGVRHLADAVAELTKVVSPRGHNHPELEKKIEEMQTNFTSLVNQVSPALVELQRQISALNLQRQVSELFDKAPAETPAIKTAKAQANDLIAQLQVAVTQNPATYSFTQRDIATRLQTITETVQAAAPANNELTAKAVALGATTDVMRLARTTTYEGEVVQNRLLDRAAGGGGLTKVLNQRGA